MDWEHPKENDFLLASQFWVTGEIYTRRPDLLGFVNGLPLVFIELKASSQTSRERLSQQPARLQRHHPATLLVQRPHHPLERQSATRLGSLTAEWEHFTEWKRINCEGEEGVISLETMLRGVCDKSRLLDIVENFILFTEAKDGLQKLIANEPSIPRRQ